MEAHALYELLEKYRLGTCTPGELEQLEKWYASLGADRREQLFEEGGEAALLLTRQKLKELKSMPGQHETPVVSLPRWKKARRWAAVAAGFVIAAGSVWYAAQPTARPARLVAEYRKPAAHVRHVALPDGSLVILQANSRLEYPAAFSGGTREVTLVGEAFFDIRTDTLKPFIIHSGSLRTTVLGTAFNIRAYENAKDITVSVTRGRVKVETEQDNQLLAVLTPDQQVVFNGIPGAAQKQPIAADSIAAWVRKDMVFEDLTFKAVAQVLAGRYNVNIRFDNPALENCPVRASFSGTESIDKILGVLCTIRNASFTISDDEDIVITGEGCQQ